MSLPVQYEVDGSDKPNEWQLGTRLRLMRLSNWDFSVSYSQTTYQMPSITTTVRGTFGSPTLPVLISLFPHFYRVKTTGFDVSGAVGSVGVRAEGAVRNAVDTVGAGAKHMGDVWA